MSVENLRSVMHIDPLKDVLYSIPVSYTHLDVYKRQWSWWLPLWDSLLLHPSLYLW